MSADVVHGQEGEQARAQSPASLQTLPLPPFPLGGDSTNDADSVAVQDAATTNDMTTTTTTTTEPAMDGVRQEEETSLDKLEVNGGSNVVSKVNGAVADSQPTAPAELDDLQSKTELEITPGDHQQTQESANLQSPHLPLPPFPLGAQMTADGPATDSEPNTNAAIMPDGISNPPQPERDGSVQVPAMWKELAQDGGARADDIDDKDEDKNGQSAGALAPTSLVTPALGEALNHEAESMDTNTNVSMGGGESLDEPSVRLVSDDAGKVDERKPQPAFISSPEQLPSPPISARPYVSPLDAHQHFVPSPPATGSGAFVLDNLRMSLQAISASPSPLPTPHGLSDARQTDSPLLAPQLPFIDTSGPSLPLGFDQGPYPGRGRATGVPMRSRRLSAMELSPASTPADQLLAAHRDLRRFSLFDSGADTSLELLPPLRPGALGASRRSQSAVDLHAVNGLVNPEIAIPPHLRPARGRKVSSSALGYSFPRSDSANTFGTEDSDYSRSSSRSRLADTTTATTTDGSASEAPASQTKQRHAVRYSTFAEMGIANVAVAGKGERTIDAKKREQQLAVRAERAKQNRGNRLSKAFTRDNFSISLPGVGSGKADGPGTASDASEMGEASRPGSRPSSSAGRSPASTPPALPPGAAAPALMQNSMSTPPQLPSQGQGESGPENFFEPMQAQLGVNVNKGAGDATASHPGLSPPKSAASAKKIRKAKSRDCVIM